MNINIIIMDIIFGEYIQNGENKKDINKNKNNKNK